MNATVEQASTEEARPRPSWKAIAIFIAVLVVVGGAPLVLTAITPHFHANVYPESLPAPAFELPRADGAGTYNLSDSQGRVVVLYFGYTSCPDVCPTTLLDLRDTMAALGDQRDEVDVIFVTVDPEFDTAERIQTYLSAFDSSFVGLYGQPGQIEPVADAYQIDVLTADQTAIGSGLTHTTSLFAIDRKGRLRLRMHYGTDPEIIADDLRILIRERG